MSVSLNGRPPTPWIDGRAPFGAISGRPAQLLPRPGRSAAWQDVVVRRRLSRAARAELAAAGLAGAVVALLLAEVFARVVRRG